MQQSYTVKTKSDGKVTVTRDINAYDVGAAIGVGIGLVSILNSRAVESLARGYRSDFDRFISSGDYDAAYQTATKMVASSNEELQVMGRIHQAIALRRLGRPLDGISPVTAAIKKMETMSVPNIEAATARAYFERGLCYQSAGTNAEAIRDYTQSIRLNPQQADTALDYCQRGMALREIGNYEQALSDLTQAIKLEPGVGRFYAERAVLYESMGQVSIALKDCQTAITLDPTCVLAYKVNASLLSSQDNNAEAVTLMTKVIAENPYDNELYGLRATYYRRIGNQEMALADERKIDELRRATDAAAEAKEEAEREKQAAEYEQKVGRYTTAAKRTRIITYCLLISSALLSIFAIPCLSGFTPLILISALVFAIDHRNTIKKAAKQGITVGSIRHSTFLILISIIGFALVLLPMFSLLVSQMMQR